MMFQDILSRFMEDSFRNLGTEIDLFDVFLVTKNGIQDVKGEYLEES